MSERTRREVLAGTAALAGLGGCSYTQSDNEPESSPENNTTTSTATDAETQNPTETQEQGQNQEASVALEEEDLFNLVIDPNELYDEDIIYDKIAAPPADSPGGPMYSKEPLNRELSDTTFDIWKVKDTYNNVKTPQREKIDEMFMGDIRLPDDRTAQDIETFVRGKANIDTLIYEDSVKQNNMERRLDDRDFDLYTGDIESYDWDVYAGHADDRIYRIAIKDNKAIFVPKGRENSGNTGSPKIIKDPDAAMQVALDTYEGERPSYPENPDDLGDEALNVMIEYLENEDLGSENEDVHRYGGGAFFSEAPESGPKEVGLLSAITYEDNNMIIQGPGVTYNSNSANNLEIKEYPDRETEPMFEF